MDVNALYAQATIALKAKRNDEARKLLAEVLRLNPRHEDAWLALASVLTDMRQAIDCLKRVLAINPQNATAQEWLVFAQQEIDRQEVIKEMTAEEAPAPEAPPAEPAAEEEPRPVPRLGEYLLEYKFITLEQLNAALSSQRAAAKAGLAQRLGDILLEQGTLSEERLNFALREQHRSFYSLFDD
jgi:tetratricopeptide (TPR) repeat protein